MAYETFPTTITLSYPIVKTPVFETQVISFGGSVEQRIKRSPTPTYKFKATLDNSEIDQAEPLRLFFEARCGSFDPFYFRNPEECFGGRAWSSGIAYSVGMVVHPVTPNGRSYKCTTAGSSGGTEPTWPTTTNGAVADGGAVWTENTYLVRFVEDEINQEYFNYLLYNFGTFEMVETDG
jgi:hypothetical protein